MTSPKILTAMAAALLTLSALPAGAAGPVPGAQPWGGGNAPWNGRSWNWHTPRRRKRNSAFSWGTGDTDNPWDEWMPWNKDNTYPWETDTWDELPWSGNRPWDRSGFEMPWSKKKPRYKRRKEYLDYLRDKRIERLRRAQRKRRYPPPPWGYGYGYPGYAYPGYGYPAQGAPMMPPAQAPAPAAPSAAAPAPAPAPAAQSAAAKAPAANTGTGATTPPAASGKQAE